jgi:hypothetical protein
MAKLLSLQPEAQTKRGTKARTWKPDARSDWQKPYRESHSQRNLSLFVSHLAEEHDPLDA